MTHLNEEATRVAEKLLSMLDHKSSVKIDNSPGAFMAVHLERRHNFKNFGKIFSVAHYYTQEGDLMSDPFMEFIKLDRDSKIYPITFEQHGSLATYQEAATIDNTGTAFKSFYPKIQKQLVEFANQWMQNIESQQFAS